MNNLIRKVVSLFSALIVFVLFCALAKPVGVFGYTGSTSGVSYSGSGVSSGGGSSSSGSYTGSTSGVTYTGSGVCSGSSCGGTTSSGYTGSTSGVTYTGSGVCSGSSCGGVVVTYNPPPYVPPYNPPSYHCTSNCSVSGQRQCSGNGYRECSKHSDGCYYWGSVINCGSNHRCDNGSCIIINTCSDECSPSGKRECSGNGYRQCGNYDSDNCLEWSGVTNCGFNERCDNGSCRPIPPSCTDECSVFGKRECSGNGWRQCGNYDSDSCKEWGSVNPCGFNETCSNGSCKSTCQNECSFGDHQCSGTSGRTCNNSGNCTAWGNYQTCDSRCYRCGDGRCDSDCGETKSSCSQDCGKNCDDLNVNAGSDKKINDNNESVRLDGSVNGDYDRVRWTCTGGDLSSSTILRPNFEADSYDRDRTYTCTLTAWNDCGSDSDSMKVTVEKEDSRDFNVSLTARPKSDCAPLNDVDLIAQLSNYGGSNSDYTYYFDCDNDGDWEKTVTTGNTSYTASNLCDYRNIGTYAAKVKVTSRNRTAIDTASVRATDCRQEEHNDLCSVGITKNVRNITGGTGYSGTVAANPGDTLSYRIVITGVSGRTENVNVSDIIPNGIVNIRDVQVDGYNQGNSLSGMNLGQLSSGQTKTITYTANTANLYNFGYGQTTLTNTVTVTADGQSTSANAAVTVYRRAVQGATTVSTGFDGNMFAGLAAAIIGLAACAGWILKEQIFTFFKKDPAKVLRNKIAFVKRNGLAE